MFVKGFRLVACAIAMAASGGGALAASGHHDRRACAGLDIKLSAARRQEYAGLVAAAAGERVKPSKVRVYTVLSSGSWSMAYAAVPVADNGYFFFEGINGEKKFKDVWGGMAEPSERPALIAWARKISAPESLAACFAEAVVGG